MAIPLAWLVSLVRRDCPSTNQVVNELCCKKNHTIKGKQKEAKRMGNGKCPKILGQMRKRGNVY